MALVNAAIAFDLLDDSDKGSAEQAYRLCPNLAKASPGWRLP
ncbi:MAG: hypothetical protein ACR5LD_05300 [Symbiopectobacterium sp.]